MEWQLSAHPRLFVDKTSSTFVAQLLRIVCFLVAAVIYAHLIPTLRHLGTALLASAGVISLDWRDRRARGAALPGRVLQRSISAGLVVLLFALPTAAEATVDTSWDDGRLQQRCRRAEFHSDPLDELERADRTLAGLLGRRVPEWSPEADAIRWEVDSILAGMLDYEQIARSSLGDDWDRLSAAQRAAFMKALAGLTNRAFVSAITRSDVQLRFDSETVLGPKASVMVTATVPGRPQRPTSRSIPALPETRPMVDLRRSCRWGRPWVC